MNENKRLREKSPPRRNDRCYRINVLRRFDTILLGAPWRWLRFYFEFTDFSRLLGWDLRIIFRGNDFRLYSSTFISLLDQYTHKQYSVPVVYENMYSECELCVDCAHVTMYIAIAEFGISRLKVADGSISYCWI